MNKNQDIRSDRYADQYFGLWAIEETRAVGLMEVARSMDVWGHLTEQQEKRKSRGAQLRSEAGPYQDQMTFDGRVTDDGVAVLPVRGTLMKFGSSMSASTGTVYLRRQVRAAARDSRVKGILLMVDSPGGTVAGTAEMGDEVMSAAKQKPVWAYAEDLMASAAYWISAGATKIGANRTAMVGSLGTIMALYDWSRAFKKEGIQPHVYSTGKFKGAGALGTKVTAEHDEYFQKLANDTNQHFKDQVAAGRKGIADVEALFDGRVHLAEAAEEAGLIDEVSGADAFYQKLVKSIGGGRAVFRGIGAMKAQEEITLSADGAMGECEVSAVEETEGADMAKNDGDKEPVAPKEQSAPAAGGVQPVVSKSEGSATTQAAAQVSSEGERLVQGAALLRMESTADRISAIESVCPGASAEFVLAQAKAGASDETAQREWIKAQAKTIEGLTASKQKLEMELSEATAKLKAAETESSKRLEASGVTPVTSQPAGATVVEASDDPKAQAKAEWEANFNDCRKQFRSEEAYRGHRVHELRKKR